MIALLLILAFGSGAQAAALIDPALKSFDGGLRRVIILPVAQTNLPRPRRYDRQSVINYYREVARLSVTPIFQSEQRGELPGVTFIHVFWVNSSIVADVTYGGLKALALHPDVYKIYADGRTHGDGFHLGHRYSGSPLEGSENRYDFVTTEIDRVHREFPSVNGDGVIVGVEDSGVFGSHPALHDRVAIFYSGREHKVSAPEDFDDYHGHGTHVCGTIAGTLNDIGVAPGSKLAVAGTVLDGEGNFPFDEQLEGMQWFVDLEKNSAVATRIKVVNNSWMSEGAPDLELFYRALAAWEASGILPVFSAGNDGENGAGTITHPHEYPGTFTVANY
jgi:subtilisin family serine protease